jgi:hypothetical protein
MSAPVAIVEQLPDASDSQPDAHSVAAGFSPSVPSRRVRADSASRALVREALRGRVVSSSDTPPPVVLDARGVRALPALSSSAAPAVVGREARAADDERYARALVVESATLAATVPSGEVVDALREGAALGFIPSTTADSAAARLSSWNVAHLAALNAKRDAEARRLAARHDAATVAPVVPSRPSPVIRATPSAEVVRAVPFIDRRVRYDDASVGGLLRRLCAAGVLTPERYDGLLSIYSRDGWLPPAITRRCAMLLRRARTHSSRCSQTAIASRRDGRARVPVIRGGLRYSVVLRRAVSRYDARALKLFFSLSPDDRVAVVVAFDAARYGRVVAQFGTWLAANAPIVAHSRDI